jgi:hypothetical protein
MFRSIRVDHTNCLQVTIKTHSFIVEDLLSRLELELTRNKPVWTLGGYGEWENRGLKRQRTVDCANRCRVNSNRTWYRIRETESKPEIFTRNIFSIHDNNTLDPLCHCLTPRCPT